MAICSNPEHLRVRVPVGDAAVILILRRYTAREFARFMGGRYQVGRRNRFKDQSMEHRIQFVDQLLVGIEGRERDGAPTEVTYWDAEANQEKPLTPQVPDWKEHVNPSWKIAAALELEGESAEVEIDVLGK